MPQKNRLLSSGDFSLRFASNVVEGTQYLHPVAGSAEEVSLG
jgi:hypothetical protein